MVKRPSRKFVCQQCGNTHAKWSGKCVNCGAWNTLIEESTTDVKLANLGTELNTQTLGKSGKPAAGGLRYTTGSSDMDRVLGGGIVAGSLTLVAGEPGIGKSTLLLQLAAGVARKDKVLYVSGEESLAQINMRADRLKINQSNLEISSSVSTDDVIATAGTNNYRLIVVDSIQTMSTQNVSSSAGSISQITSSAQLLQSVAKTTQTAVIVVGHVTKEGNIAGPKLLEHIVDTVLYLEGEKFGSFKILRSVKNRFGPTYEIGMFEMRGEGMRAVGNPSKMLLQERQEGDGSVVYAAIEGSRPVLVEIQALTTPSNFGYPKRTSVGIELNRLNLLIAVLERRGGIKLGSTDVYVNVVGGIKVSEPAADLAVALAIASSKKVKPLISSSIVFGELGLNGEVRSVSQSSARIAEAKKHGFSYAIAPKQHSSGSAVKGVSTLSDAIKLGLKN